MAKLVMWLPRGEAQQASAENVMIVKTADDCFLRAFSEDHEIWNYNADHVRRWVVAHNKHLLRLSQDQKYELRRTDKARMPINEYREALTRKQRERMKSFMHQTASLLVQHAKRSKISIVKYNDNEKGYLRSFPWFEFRNLLAQKLSQANIAFKETSVDVQTETDNPLE